MDETHSSPPRDVRLEDLVFVGFNSRIAALHRDTGEIVWDWTSPEGSGFVALLLDDDRLIASVHGYTYCLDPATGQALWSNPLRGYGVGVPSLASVAGTSSRHGALGQEGENEAQRNQST